MSELSEKKAIVVKNIKEVLLAKLSEYRDERGKTLGDLKVLQAEGKYDKNLYATVVELFLFADQIDNTIKEYINIEHPIAPIVLGNLAALSLSITVGHSGPVEDYISVLKSDRSMGKTARSSNLH